MSPSKHKTNLDRFLKILSDFQHDLTTRVLPMTLGRQLTLSQYLLLGMLQEFKKPVAISLLASLMETTIPVARILIDRLVAMECVNQSSANGCLYITRAGLKELDAVNSQRSEQIENLLLRLTDAERAMGLVIYEKMLRQRMEGKPPVHFQHERVA